MFNNSGFLKMLSVSCAFYCIARVLNARQQEFSTSFPQIKTACTPERHMKGQAIE